MEFGCYSAPGTGWQDGVPLAAMGSGYWQWASTVEGADALKLRWGGLFEDLPDLCDELEALHGLAHDKAHFAFVDSLVQADPQTRSAVWEEVARLIRTSQLTSLGLNPGTLVDWTELEFGLLSVTGYSGPHVLDDLTVQEYFDRLTSLGVAANLDGDELKKHKVRFTDATGHNPPIQLPVRLCDVLAASGPTVIHAKRRFGSAGLSHLFSQALVSAELLLKNRDFRLKVRRKMKGQEQPIWGSGDPRRGRSGNGWLVGQWPPRRRRHAPRSSPVRS
ncbi:MAG: hypothetical protein ACI9OJ_000702 [Myxococcota bacterium]|jgi:hypothetical protein